MREETSKPIDNEVERLRACVNDLTSLLALPAIFTGREPDQIIAALLDVLMGILRLDAAYAEIKDPAGCAPISMMRPVLSENPTVGRLEIQQALNHWLKEDLQPSSLVLKQSTGGVPVGIRCSLGTRNAVLSSEGWHDTSIPTDIDKPRAVPA
jgi:hypothetical protein